MAAREFPISTASLDDAKAVISVNRDVWIKDYVNETYGVTREKVEDYFAGSHSQETVAWTQARLLTTPKQQSWVAKDGDLVVAFAMVLDRGDYIYVRALNVHPSYQRMAIGTRLLKQALDWATASRDIRLNAVCYVDHAVRFYKKHAFVENGRDPDESDRLRLLDGTELPQVQLEKRKQETPK